MSKLFFIALGYRYDSYWRMGDVYGPFENMDELKTATKSQGGYIWAQGQEQEFLVFEGEVIKQPTGIRKKK